MPTSISLDIPKAATLFHALSDQTRLEIILLLLNGERCVCDLTDTLDAAQSRLSFHLKTLKDAGIVSDRRVGRWIYYSLDRDTFEAVEELVGAIKPSRRASSAACCG